MTRPKRCRGKSVYFLEGGLGNQAAITAHALAHNDKKQHIRVSTFKYFSNLEKRNFVLEDYFNFDSSEIVFMQKRIDRYVYLILKVWSKIIRKPTVNLRVLGCIYRLGYHQDDMIENIKFLKPHLRMPIESTSHLSIHIRRGDYTHAKHQSHGLISVNDVKTVALKILRENNLRQISIISEDPDIFTNFANDNNFESLELNDCTLSRECDVFRTMLNSSFIIATNSTFSLLAGSLSNGQLFIPDIWDKSQSSTFLGTDVKRYGASFELEDMS